MSMCAPFQNAFMHYTPAGYLVLRQVRNVDFVTCSSHRFLRWAQLLFTNWTVWLPLWILDFKLSPWFEYCKCSFGSTVYIQPLKMELTQCSETSANYNLTPGKYPKEHLQLPLWSLALLSLLTCRWLRVRDSHTVSPTEYSGPFLRVRAHEAKSDPSSAGQNTIFYKTVTSMLHCICGLKSTVKWLFNIRIRVDGGDLDDSVCCFIVFLNSVSGPFS